MGKFEDLDNLKEQHEAITEVCISCLGATHKH